MFYQPKEEHTEHRDGQRKADIDVGSLEVTLLRKDPEEEQAPPVFNFAKLLSCSFGRPTDGAFDFIVSTDQQVGIGGQLKF